MTIKKQQIKAGFDALHAHETYYGPIEEKPDRAAKNAWICPTCHTPFMSAKAGDEHTVEEIMKATAQPQAARCGARWLREEPLHISHLDEPLEAGDWRCALPLEHGGVHVDGTDGTRWDERGRASDAIGEFFPPLMEEENQVELKVSHESFNKEKNDVA